MKLWENGTPYYDEAIGQPETEIIPYLLEGDAVRPCVIVFPGGGYTHRAYHEGEPVAQWLNSIGIHAFVLEYRIHPYTYKAILADALRAVRFVRYHAAEFGIDPQKIGTLGFSAGGHLASCTAFCYDMAELNENDPVDKVSSRADLSVLCYPVVSLASYANHGSRESFLGDEMNNWTLIRRFSAEENVTENTPPIFMWHASDDLAVPVENSLQLATALRRKSIPFALHVYPFGGHGKGLATDLPMMSAWADTCAEWLRYTFEMEK
ncbi:MAG: alpha/beta hydrolase [Clostridia bacterium]|nr:alpha/beta hydrolase [Clostridia bacterium]